MPLMKVDGSHLLGGDRGGQEEWNDVKSDLSAPLWPEL